MQIFLFLLPFFCIHLVFFVGTPPFSLKQRDYLRFRPQQGCFCPLNNPYPKSPNCPHCGQMCLPRGAHDPAALSCFLAAFSPRRPKSLDFDNFQRFPAFAASGFSRGHLVLFRCFLPTLPHGGATSGLRASGGYAPGCVRKIGHSRDTRLTRADRRFSAAPVGTLPTAFGCVPAHIPRPALQAFARKTAGWRTEWAGACTKGFHFACVRPV